MADEPQDTQAARRPGPRAGSEGSAATPQDTATGAVTPRDGPMDRPGTEAEGEAAAPMTNEPLPVAEDEAGVGLSRSPDETIEGNRGM